MIPDNVYLKCTQAWYVSIAVQCRACEADESAEQTDIMAACRTVLLLLTLACACADDNSTAVALLRWLKASNGTVRQALQ